MQAIDYIDISAAVHARAGLGRYSEELARALLTAVPERFGLFYNQGKDGRFPPGLQSFQPDPAPLGAGGLQAVAHGHPAGPLEPHRL
jgi:hypothetical protein